MCNDDVININNTLQNLEKIVKKYNLEIDTYLFYLTIFNNDEYPTDLIKQSQYIDDLNNINNDNCCTNKNKREKNDNRNKLPYLPDYDNTEKVLRYYLNQYLKPTYNRRQWIKIKDILISFCEWYQDMYDIKIEINPKLYGTTHNILNGYNITTRGSRINGYELVTN